MAVEFAQPVVSGDGLGERFARFEALYRRYNPALVAMSFRQTSDYAAAEDIAHETLLRAYEHLDWLDVTRAWPWLKTVASRLAIDEARKLGRIRRLEAEDESVLGDANADETADATEERILLSEAMARLPTRQRTAVALRYIADYDLAEAAAALDIDHSAFKQLLFRARRRLRAEYRQLTAGASGIVLWPLAVLRRLRRLAWRARHAFARSRLRSLVQPALGLGAAILIAGTVVLNAPAGRSADPGAGTFIGGTSTMSGGPHHVDGDTTAFERHPWRSALWSTDLRSADATIGEGGTTCSAPTKSEEPEQGITTSVTDAVTGSAEGAIDMSTPSSPVCGGDEGVGTGSTSGSLPRGSLPTGSVQGAMDEVKGAGTTVSGEADSAAKGAASAVPGGTAAAQQATDLTASATDELVDQAESTAGTVTATGSN